MSLEKQGYVEDVQRTTDTGSTRRRILGLDFCQDSLMSIKLCPFLVKSYLTLSFIAWLIYGTSMPVFLLCLKEVGWEEQAKQTKHRLKVGDELRVRIAHECF